MSGRGPSNAHASSRRLFESRVFSSSQRLDNSTPTPTHVRDTEYVLPSCVSSCLLSLVLATCPISAPPSPPGLPRSGTHFHSGGRGATAHTLHRTTRHPRRHGHETYHSDPRIIFEGEGSGVCAQGVAVAPSGAAGAEHLAPAGIHASSRPPAAIKPPRCRVLRRLNICRRTGDA